MYKIRLSKNLWNTLSEHACIWEKIPRDGPSDFNIYLEFSNFLERKMKISDGAELFITMTK